MKIPPDAIIPPAKLTQYLLRFRTRNDKSGLLGRIGFSIDKPTALEEAIRLHANQGEAMLDERDVYGDRYILGGTLAGPKGTLFIQSVWVRRTGETSIRFVTLKPAKEEA